MAKVRVALAADNFHSDHAVAMIGYLLNDPVGERLEIAWPAAACVKFVVGVKQGCLATDAVVLPLIPVVPVGPCEGWLGVLKPRDCVLHVGKRFSIHLVGLLKWCSGRGTCGTGLHGQDQKERKETLF